MKIIIHGVHRSGTSMTAAMVESLGAWWADSDQRMPGNVDNPKGYWERLDVVDINDRILRDCGMTWNSLRLGISSEKLAQLVSHYGDEIEDVLRDLQEHSMWMLKDPRFSFTWPVWRSFVGADAYHIVVTRHPVAVAKSLMKRNGIPLEVGLAFWTHQAGLILQSVKDESEVCYTIFDGSEDCAEVMQSRVSEFLTNKESGEHLTGKSSGSLFRLGMVHQTGETSEIPSSFSATLELWEKIVDSRTSEINEVYTGLELLGWKHLDSSHSASTLAEQYEEILNLKSGLLSIRDAELKSKTESLNLKDAELKIITEELNLKEAKLNKMREELSLKVADKELFAREVLEGLVSFRKTRTYRFAGFILYPIWLLRGRPKNVLDEVSTLAARELGLQSAGNPARPYNSARSLVAAILKNPVVFLKKMTFSRMALGAKILLGIENSSFDLEQSLKNYSAFESGEKLELDIIEDPSDMGDIQFEIRESPDISIVIPVYNNYKTTLSCLESIVRNTSSDLNYEVVIADDCSSDLTTSFEEIKGLSVIRTEHNKGFVGNCNNAVSQVRGRYIALLNNDTNVQKGWLSALHSRIEANSDIGVVGPMFVYPDGRLQEAGGIIFSDASGWNYGRLDNPTNPEYQFMRESDYISGACLMFRKVDWQKLGGFDEIYSPAYFEDSDLCFAMRQIGLKVVYEPKSVVVHFEGISHGTDENSGIKRFQNINREKFLEKWKDTLVNDHFANDKHWFRARTRGRKRKTILVIDHYVPMYDRDAGSRTVQMYVQLMLDAGHHVIFMGDNFYPHQPYTEDLQSLGVEVLYGKKYHDNWFDWLSENHSGIDCIFLNRPHVTINYIDKILSLPRRPRTVYYGLDLHFVRLQREEKLGIKNESGRSMASWRELELNIMRKADLVLYPSDFEIETVKGIDSEINIQAIPIFWFEEESLNRRQFVVDSPKIMFVGGFGHPPNVDGLNWFLSEIFPGVLAQYPDVVLTIIGSKCPPSVFELASENIEVLGEVSEEELQQAYDQARVAVVPLRYGAGVKGKVIEAMKNGIPVVTTPVGAEGLPSNPEHYLAVESEPDKYTSSLIQCLESDEHCEKKIAMSHDILEEYFSRKAAQKVLDQFFLDDIGSST